MGEESLIARAEIVEAALAVRRPEEAVLRTPAVAHGQDLAGLAKAGQPVQLGLSEGPLRRAFEQLDQRGLPDIPEAVLRVDKMIAGEEVAVMLDDGDVAAGLPEDAEGVLPAEGRCDCLLEYLHFDAPDILAQPLVKNGAEKIAEGLGRHRAVAYAAVRRRARPGAETQYNRPRSP